MDYPARKAHGSVPEMTSEVYFRRLAAVLMGSMFLLAATWGTLRRGRQRSGWGSKEKNGYGAPEEWAQILRRGVPTNVLPLDLGDISGADSRPAKPLQEKALVESNDDQRVSTQARVEMTVARLGIGRAKGKLQKRGVFAAVSGMGVIGMYAAIVGAMVGVWLEEVNEDADDDDGFSYWDNIEDTEEDMGRERERHYGGMREVGGLLYSS